MSSNSVISVSSIHSPSPSPIFLVVNPASGSRGAAQFASDVVEPLLHKNRLSTAQRLDTTASGDGVRVGKSIRHQVDDRTSRQDGQKSASATVILLGGDGTTHEVLNGFYHDALDTNDASNDAPSLYLIVIPTGTANALYSALYPPPSSSRHQGATKGHGPEDEEWRLRSLRAYLSSLSASPLDHASTHRAFGLTLAVSTTLDATDAFEESKPSDSDSAPMIAHLVTSHALHASILLDSEKLRSTHPSVERFKIAAQANMTNWVDGTLTLRGREAAGVPVQRYNPDVGQFISVPDGDDALRLDGPVFYLASATVDRFEPTFVPAPFAFPESSSSSPSSPTPSSSLARPLDALDVVLIRPLRDPLVKQHLPPRATNWEDDTTLPARQAFAQHRAGPITMGMYGEGSHVSLRYSSSSSSAAASAESVPPIGKEEKGDTAVEYYRVGSWTWEPSHTSTRAPLTCIDGTLRHSPVRTSSRALPQLANKVSVWY